MGDQALVTTNWSHTLKQSRSQKPEVNEQKITDNNDEDDGLLLTVEKTEDCRELVHKGNRSKTSAKIYSILKAQAIS